MTTIGYKLSSEEFGPRELVRLGRLAEESGFRFALISDHFHPWTETQGQSPFVWSVIGGLAEATSTLIVGPGVYAEAGFDHVCIHQVGPDQEGFLRFYAREVLPQLGRRRAAA